MSEDQTSRGEVFMEYADEGLYSIECSSKGLYSIKNWGNYPTYYFTSQMNDDNSQITSLYNADANFSIEITYGGDEGNTIE